MSLGRRSVVVAVTFAFAMLGGPALAATGASQTVTYSIVETRGISVGASSDQVASGVVTSFGEASRVTVSIEGGSAVVGSAGTGTTTIGHGEHAVVAVGEPLRYRISPGATEPTITFTVSAG